MQLRIHRLQSRMGRLIPQTQFRALQLERLPRCFQRHRALEQGLGLLGHIEDLLAIAKRIQLAFRRRQLPPQFRQAGAQESEALGRLFGAVTDIARHIRIHERIQKVARAVRISILKRDFNNARVAPGLGDR